MSAFQRFLQDFATGNTLDVDSQGSQEYEDVECSQIYLPGLDETQIVDEENETVSSVFLHWFDLIRSGNPLVQKRFRIGMYLISTLCFRPATKTCFYSSWFSVKSFCTSKQGMAKSKVRSLHHSFYQTDGPTKRCGTV